MTNIHYLAAANGKRLSKEFWLDDDNAIAKSSYPHIKNFNSFEAPINTIQDLFDSIKGHADQGHCLLKGQLDRSLSNESRAGHTSPDTLTDWMVLDVDHLDHIPPEEFMAHIGLGDVSYIIQHSVSAGIVSGKNSYHIFVVLDKPYHPSALKGLLKHWNLSIPEFRAEIRLIRTNCALRWPLDISVCQNDKLLYIAPPILGGGITDPFPQRIELVERAQPRADLSGLLAQVTGTSVDEKALLNQLRAEKGLPEKPYSFQTHGDVEVLSNPDVAALTGRKEERDFVYLNLNGGDSWGYYHPIGSPEVLFNFKGEHSYLIKELLPDYYPEAKQRAKEFNQAMVSEAECNSVQDQAQVIKQSLSQVKPTYLVFREQREDKYYVGHYDPATGTHDFNVTSSKIKGQEFLIQQGLERPKIILTWKYRFEPANDAVFDPDNLFINKFVPSTYLANAEVIEIPSIPTTIQRVIEHVLANDPEMVENFLNWLAVIFQYRVRTQTAWILQGTTGTGKGILVNEIIRPLLGSDYCRTVTLENMEDQFNAHLGKCLFLNVDEVDTDQVRKMPNLIAQLKNMITEPRLAIRAMRTDLAETANHLNIVMCSNQPNSMRIEENDRRFNVCARQERKLLAPGENGAVLVSDIQSELQDFANYLKSRVADKQKASRPIENGSKQLLQSITQTAAEEVARALRDGDFGYFFLNRPAKDGFPTWGTFEGKAYNLDEDYHSVLVAGLAALNAGKPAVVLWHDELFALFEYLVGEMPKRKAKLTKRLGHLGLTIQNHTFQGKSRRGLKVLWKGSAHERQQWQKILDKVAEKESNHGNP